jgi:hydrogenase-4 component E
MQGPADALLVLVLLVGLSMLGALRLATCIRASALQAVLIAPLPWLLHPETRGVHLVVLTAVPLILKGIVVPNFLFYTLRETRVRHEVEFFLGSRAALLVAGLGVVLAFALSERLAPGLPQTSRFLIPIALSTVLVGLLMLVTHAQAILQVVGYLVLENGILLFGLALAGAMPWIVEAGILLDVFVGVFIMGIAVHHIQRTFESAGPGEEAP